MKRMLVLFAACSGICLLNIITVLVLASLAGVPIGVAGPIGGSCEVGDVNGDGAIDISDPIGLLSFIFEGGPAPVACAQDPLDLSQLEGVLAKFWPRAGDLYYEEIEVEASAAEQVILTVPAGKVFVLTNVSRLSQVTVEKNGVDLRVTNEFTNVWRESSGNFFAAYSQQVPIQFPFLPGDVLSASNSDAGPNSLRLWGYFSDL